MTEAEPPSPVRGSIADILARAVAQSAARPAVIDRDRAVDFATLARQSAGVARVLGAHGVAPGDRVAIFLERGVDAVAAYFGAASTGAIVTIVNDRLRPRQVEYVLQHAGVRVLITSGELLDRQPRPLETTAAVVRAESIEAGPEPLVPAARLESDPAQIIYTSGSTGLPKGVVFTHGALRAGIAIVSRYLELRESDRIASLLPLSSVYGLNQLLCAVVTGAALVVEKSPVPAQIVSAMRAHQVTVLAAVPPLWLQLLGVPAFVREPVASLRVAQNAGGHLPSDAVRQVRSAQPHVRLFLQYGMTETLRSTFLPPDEVDAHPESMGRAMPDTEILVVRDDGTLCDTGETGELVHRGPTVAAGYWNDPEATARVFRPDPRRPADPVRVVFSGDLVRRDESGLLYFVGRRDRMIKTLGFRVGPDEIVDVLFASREVAEAVVTAEPDAQRGERIVAYVVLKDGGSAERLTLFARTELPRHMQPARIEVRDAMPRLASGKYDLGELTGGRATEA